LLGDFLRCFFLLHITMLVEVLGLANVCNHSRPGISKAWAGEAFAVDSTHDFQVN
jgi:hypothetical protein